jgi:hypothetical protein
MKIFSVTIKDPDGWIVVRKLVPAKSHGHAASILTRGIGGYSPVSTSVMFAYDDETFDDAYRKYRPIY